MAVITFANYRGDASLALKPADSCVAITKSDDDTFAQPVRVYCGGAGNVVYTPADGGTDVTVAVVAGAYLPSRAIAVKSTNTTATGLFAVY